jgi:hypothetical protein
MHITDNEDALLDYLYDEGEPAERIRIASHLQECAACSVAVLELQSVRGLLKEWTPPAATLGYAVVQTPVPASQPTPPRMAARTFPRWAQAAAAVALFVGGMAASQLQIEFGNGALTVRSRAIAPEAADAAVMHSGTDILLAPRFTADRSASFRPVSTDEIVQQVKALINQSETRQQRELALRLSDVVHDFDTQRQADMRRVDQNLGQLEGQTGEEVARQRELLNSLVKVSQGGTR